MSTFDSSEYEHQQARSRIAADTIMPIVIEATGATSVLDVGCGVGTCLAACDACGIRDYVGLDGEGASTMLQIPRDRFRVADLSRPLELNRTFDLAMSLELAEHLPPDVGPAFVKELTDAAPAVLFSAAIPSQGGVRHLNERWQSYWAGLFAGHGVSPIDLVRPALWHHSTIPFWYRQNLLLYVKQTSMAAPPTLVDVVHPDLFSRVVEQLSEPRHISGREAASVLLSKVMNRLRLRR